jgi:hypothetical protein
LSAKCGLNVDIGLDVDVAFSYQAKIKEWYHRHPQTPGTPAVATDQSYASLLEALTLEADMLIATTIPPQHAPHVVATDYTTVALAATAATTTKPAVAAKPATTARSYCWSHGTCGHPSLDCKHPLSSHQTAATRAQPMGGATYSWAKLTLVQRKAPLLLKPEESGTCLNAVEL